MFGVLLLLHLGIALRRGQADTKRKCLFFCCSSAYQHDCICAPVMPFVSSLCSLADCQLVGRSVPTCMVHDCVLVSLYRIRPQQSSKRMNQLNEKPFFFDVVVVDVMKYCDVDDRRATELWNVTFATFERRTYKNRHTQIKNKINDRVLLGHKLT